MGAVVIVPTSRLLGPFMVILVDAEQEPGTRALQKHPRAPELA